MPQTPDPSSQHGPDQEGSKFKEMINRMKTSEALTDSESMSMITERMSENFVEIAKQQSMTAVLMKHKYDALVKAGFTEQQAMTILLAR